MALASEHSASDPSLGVHFLDPYLLLAFADARRRVGVLKPSPSPRRRLGNVWFARRRSSFEGYDEPEASFPSLSNCFKNSMSSSVFAMKTGIGTHLLIVPSSQHSFSVFETFSVGRVTVSTQIDPERLDRLDL